MVQRLIPAYCSLLEELAGLGVPEVQIHEPILVKTEAADLEADFKATYEAFAKVALASRFDPYSCTNEKLSVLSFYRLGSGMCLSDKRIYTSGAASFKVSWHLLALIS